MSPDWTDPAWLEESRAWIDAELARHGLSVAGTVEQPHVRPWSTVLRIPTPAGDVWFKASMPAVAYEVGVLPVLVARRPECLPRLLAADSERGWMLQADGGTRLRELLAEHPDFSRWKAVLPLYADLQLAVAADRDELLAAGAPDRRLAGLPALYEDLLARQGSLSADELIRLRDLTPTVAQLCDELGAYGLPETIQHDDLHDGNVFVRDGAYVFFDWGDACVAHPFFTLHVTMRVLAHNLGVEEEAPELERYRDAYLEPWTTLRPRADLLRALEPADLLAGIARALAWQRVTDGVPPDVRGDYEDAVVDRLRTFVAAVG
jgi:hypothetical protein